MQDAGIVRNRLKIEASVSNAQAYLAIPDFSAYLWDFIDGQAAAKQLRSMKDVPAKTPLAEKISKDMKKTRLPLRRPHHRLCLHAGLRAGQRPHGHLPSP